MEIEEEGEEEEEIYTREEFVASINRNLPLHGDVTCIPARKFMKKKKYYFLKLPDEWNDRKEFFCKHIKNLYQYDKKAKDSLFHLVRKINQRNPVNHKVDSLESKFFTPPFDDIGFHISIDKSKMVKNVEFVVEKIVQYRNQRSGHFYRPDESKYPAEIFALRVKIKNEGGNIIQVSSPHVTIAMYGFHFNKPLVFKEEKMGKKKK